MLRISVLYVSYTGITSPLGQSQVLEYVLALAPKYRMVLVSFESEDHGAMLGRERVASLCSQAGVEWRPVGRGSASMGFSRAWCLFYGLATAVWLAFRRRVGIVHCRSYIGGLIGVVVKRVVGCSFLFDMRGFWPDERVEAGVWPKGCLRYRVFKFAERVLLRQADHIVSLTRAGRSEIEEFDCLAGRRVPVSVIPTCTNLSNFTPVQWRGSEAGFTLGYVGSSGSWYLFSHVAIAVALLFESDSDARFLMVTQDDQVIVQRELVRAGVDLGRVEICAAVYADVPALIARMDAGIFFIRPVWSKTASCPTRMGEFLACGKPCLSNTGVGDVAADFRSTKTGVALDDLSTESIKAGLDELRQLASDSSVARRCRAAAEDLFSLGAGVDSYGNIYERLSRVSSEEV